MALNTQLSDAAANAACNAVTVLANGGSIKLYSGVQPTNGNTALGAQVLLATLVLSATAFAPAVGGVAAANAITPATIAVSGTATWFRVLKSDGVSVVFDGSIGTAGCNYNMNSNVLSAGATAAMTGLTYSIVEAGA